jgi:hypothetical protein
MAEVIQVLVVEQALVESTAILAVVLDMAQVVQVVTMAVVQVVVV